MGKADVKKTSQDPCCMFHMYAEYPCQINIEPCYQWRAVCMETCKYGLGAGARKPTDEKPQGVLYRAYVLVREETS